MLPTIADTLYVSLAVVRLHVLTQLIRILSYLAESCLLRCSRLKTLRQRVGAAAVPLASQTSERLRRRFRQEWSEASLPGQVAPRSVIAQHYCQEKWPGE